MKRPLSCMTQSRRDGSTKKLAQTHHLPLLHHRHLVHRPLHRRATRSHQLPPKVAHHRRLQPDPLPQHLQQLYLPLEAPHRLHLPRATLHLFLDHHCPVQLRRVSPHAHLQEQLLYQLVNCLPRLLGKREVVAQLQRRHDHVTSMYLLKNRSESPIWSDMLRITPRNNECV